MNGLLRTFLQIIMTVLHMLASSTSDYSVIVPESFKIPGGLASGSGQNLQDVIGGLFKDILNGVYFGLSLIFRTIFCLSQSEVNQMFKIQSGDDLEQVQKTYYWAQNNLNIIIEKNDTEHETKARFGESILILDFNFDILYLQSARFDFS